MLDFEITSGKSSGLKCVLCDKSIGAGNPVVVASGQAELVWKVKKNFHYEAHPACAEARAHEILAAAKESK